jgi:hypothetical protein
MSSKLNEKLTLHKKKDKMARKLLNVEAARIGWLRQGARNVMK